jgi:hypothetical protein
MRATLPQRSNQLMKREPMLPYLWIIPTGILVIYSLRDALARERSHEIVGRLRDPAPRSPDAMIEFLMVPGVPTPVAAFSHAVT